jgi:signal transduction histidine kinase
MKKFGLSLKVKFIITIALTIVLTSILLTWVSIYRQQSIQEQSIRSKTITLATTLANNAEQGARDRMKDMLTRLTNNTIKEEDVLYAVIYDNLGKVLAESFSPDPIVKNVIHTSPPTKEEIDSFFTQPLIERSFKTKSAGEVIEVFAPIIFYEHIARRDITLLSNESLSKGFVIGVVRVGVTIERMKEQVRKTSNFLILITIGVILLGVAISAVFVKLLLRPVNELSLATKRISTGDLNYRVPVISADELGDLAESFNTMAQDLKDHVDELNKEKEDLITLKIMLEQRSHELEETLDKIQNIQGELLKSEKFATIGRLSATVAHELRNPLASLKNISYYLAKTGAVSDPKAQKMLEILSTDVMRANKIITDLLDYSRSKKLNKVSVPMEEFVKKAISNVTLPENVKITTDLENFTATIDPDRITQVLINLVANARDAMTDGGQIDISCHKHDQKFEIKVADNGSGMNETTLAHLFDALFTTKLKGIGLGLAIVKEIIESHFGTITVQSELGVGTTFTIVMPI